MTKPKTKKVLVTIPLPVLKDVDRAAEQQKRTRSAEMSLRLSRSFRPRKQEAAA